MKAQHIVDRLLGQHDLARRLIHEVSVHRPPRGAIWVASYSGPDGQRWQSTGTSNRRLAVLIAREFEAKARAERAKADRKPRIRIRNTAGLPDTGLTQREVALILGISERAVRAIEKRALRKLAAHPVLREIWRDFAGGGLEEASAVLSAAEIEALLDLTCTPLERQALVKLLTALAAN